MNKQEMIDLMLLEGYEQGTPMHTGLVDGAAIDREVCQEATCHECGHKGQEYHPFIARNSYRAYYVCPECGNAVEF